MSGYSQFASIYDRLMKDVDYEKRAKYVLSLFKKYSKRPTLLLDLACGTGKFSLIFAKENIEVIGVDSSEEMLGIAKENAMEAGLDILYLCQEAQKLDLFGTVDGAVCLMDSLNHITDKKELKEAIAKVSLFLEKDCLFIFDVNTIFKHKEILADNTFVFEEEGVFCVWQNSFQNENNSTDILLDFFVEEDGVYERYSEDFSERAYSEAELKELLGDCGLNPIAVFGDLSFEKPKDEEERIFIIAQKI